MLLSQSAKVISARIRTELLRRGMKHGELARMLHVDPRHLTGVISGHGVSEPLRRKIEVALDVPFWIDPARHAERRAVSQMFGGDPAAMTLGELKRIAAGHIPASELRQLLKFKPALVARLDFLAANQPQPVSV